jgi:hypothetical protein
MSDGSVRQVEGGSVDRLEGLKARLFEHFGKLTRFEGLCLERTATTVEETIRLAEEVLAAPSTGTVAEWQSYHLRLHGKRSFDVDEYLARRAERDWPATADAKGVDSGGTEPGREGV